MTPQDTVAQILSPNTLTVVRILLAIAIIVALWRAYHWMIDRGWLFDPHDPRRPMGVAAANALASIEGLYDPSAQHIVEFRRGEVAWQQFLQAGIPDDPDPASEPDSDSGGGHPG